MDCWQWKRKAPKPKKPPELNPAPSEAHIREFYRTWAWKQTRFKVLKQHDFQCQACGNFPPNTVLHVDHIKPVRYYWQLRLVMENLQVLCQDCNMGKGAWDQTDFRK